MDDIVLERSPVNVMKLSADEQALMDEIEIAPPEAPRIRPKTAQRNRPAFRQQQQYMEPPPDLDAFINPSKQTAPQQAPQPDPVDYGDYEEDEEEQGQEQDNSGGPEYQSGGDQPSPGFASIDDEKADILNKLSRLTKKGLQVSKRMTIYSSIQELRAELKRIMYGIEVDQSIKFSRRMLVACISGVEFLNKRYNPFEIQLEGWSESVMENLDDYDGVFEDLYTKYKTKMNVAPEVKLIMMLGGSAMMFHLTNSMFKAAMPNMNDVLKQNPDLVKNMMSAVQNTTTPSPEKARQPSSSSPPGARHEMKGPGFDISSLMGGIMMPPPMPVNSSSIRISSEDDDVSDIISVSGDSTGGEVREVKMGGKKKATSRKTKNVVSL